MSKESTFLKIKVNTIDVFRFYQKNESFLGIAIEDGDLSSYQNSKWIIDAYGERLHKTIEHERIVCIGTLWGTLDKFLEFSNIMWDILGKNWALTHSVVEQGVTNYLIYHEKLFNDCLVKSNNENGRIMTIGRTNRKNIFLDHQNNILNGKGQIAALVHQYDRKKDITEIIRKKYGILYRAEVKNKTPLLNKSRSKYVSPFIIFYFMFAIIVILIIINSISLYKRKKIKQDEVYDLKSISIDVNISKNEMI